MGATRVRFLEEAYIITPPEPPAARPTQPSILPRSVNEYQLILGSTYRSHLIPIVHRRRVWLTVDCAPQVVCGVYRRPKVQPGLMDTPCSKSCEGVKLIFFVDYYAFRRGVYKRGRLLEGAFISFICLKRGAFIRWERL